MNVLEKEKYRKYKKMKKRWKMKIYSYYDQARYTTLKIEKMKINGVELKQYIKVKKFKCNNYKIIKR